MSMLENGIDIFDLNTVKSMDLSHYAGVITIEEPDTDDPFRTSLVAQLVLQFHDIDMTMLGFVEPELEHVKQALCFAREIDGRLLVHCRAGVSRSTAIALAIAVEGFGVGNEKEACEWLFRARPQAEPNKLLVYLVEELFNCQGTLSGVASLSPPVLNLFKSQ